MGVKSPFFRAWFGDWRANDETPIEPVEVETIDLSDAVLEKGDYYIPDTKWMIHAGELIEGETKHHSGGQRVAVKALTTIESILNNSVLLNTNLSEKGGKKSKKNAIYAQVLFSYKI